MNDVKWLQVCDASELRQGRLVWQGQGNEMSGEQLAKNATSVCISSLGDFSEEVGQQLSEEGDLDALGINRAC